MAVFPRRRPASQEGMFQDTGGGPTSYTPTAGPGAGPPSYDISGITAGAKAFGEAKPYKPTEYGGFQFEAPDISTVAGPELVGPRAGVGPYGVTSPEMISEVGSRALKSATRPLKAQGRARMRSLTQGFEGGRMGGAAGRELALKSAMQTGEDIQEVAGDISTMMGRAELGELQTARGADYGEKRDISKGAQAEKLTASERGYEERSRVRDMEVKAEQDRQVMQATENFRAAGFSDEQARTMAQDALNRANMMMEYGFELPELQAGLTAQNQQAWQNVQARQGQLAGF